MKIVFTSGGFDPPHSGHIAYLREASKLGQVIVLLNSDSWLKAKKNYALLDWETRADILRELRCVYAVYDVDDSDGTVCEGLKRITERLRLNGIGEFIFAKGGDRTADNTPEQDICKQLGISVVFGVGGDKINSSSKIVRAVRRPADIPLVHADGA